MDLRYHVLLDKEQIAAAVQQLINTHQRMKSLVSVESTSQSIPEPEVEDDPMTLLLRQRASQNQVAPRQRHNSSIITDIGSLQHHDILDRKTDMYKFWAAHTNRELGDLCLTVLALPITQVSVERTFSGLKYILNNLRFCLKDDIIDAIMTLRTNV